MVLIRAATDADIPALVALGKQFCAVHPLITAVGYDAESLRQTLRGLLEHPESCVLVAVDQEQIVGGILGTITPVFFDLQARAACEIAWFVAEPFRKSWVATQLFSAFEAWAQAAQVQVVMVSALIDSPGVERFYQQQGYAPSEIQYWKKV